MKTIIKKYDMLIFCLILTMAFYLVNYHFKSFGIQAITNILILALIYQKRKLMGTVKKDVFFLAILLSLFQSVGHLLINDENFHVFTSIKVLLAFLLSFITGVFLFSFIIKRIFILIDDTISLNSNFIFKTVNKNSFFVNWLIIIGCWIPYLIIGYPGIMSGDFIAQANQIMGDMPYNDHNPFFHTLLIKPFMYFGIHFFNDINRGVAFYIIFQMILMSAIFSYSISYLKTINCKPLFIKASLIYFALYPVHALYSITIWSDIIFNGCLLLYIIFLAKIITNGGVFFTSKKKVLFFLATTLVMVLIRHTGIYILILSTLALSFYKLRVFKKIVLSTVIVMFFFIVIKKPIYNYLVIEKGPEGVALSIPSQQIARTMIYHKNELQDDDLKSIHAFFNKDFEKKYDSRLFRHVIVNFNESYYSKNKNEFGKLWFKLFLRFPKTYIKSFLYGNYGYWYPNVKYPIFYKYIYDNPYGIKAHYFKFMNKSLSSALTIKTIYKIRALPIISLLFSIGFCFWVLLLGFTYCLYTNRLKLTILFIPVFVLWLTAIASPVYAEFRYVYGLFTCLPILIGVSFFFNLNKQKPFN